MGLHLLVLYFNMLNITRDVDVVTKAMAQYAENITGFDPDGWLNNDNNIAYTTDEGDVALFEGEDNLPGSVCGHYFFFVRGRKAFDLANACIDRLFADREDIKRIVGLTPMDNKPALWMTRQLGFTDCGIIDTRNGPHRLSQLTRTDRSK